MNVGIIGVGLMGHGIALNILQAGFPLVLMDHPGNQPVSDPISMGATRQSSSAAVAADADLIILCVTGAPQVEAVLTGESGVISVLKDGAIIVDCSTSLPETTEKMASLGAQ